jgi:hypothetical protein
MEIMHFHTLHIEQPVEILQNRVFTEENTTSSLRKSSFPFFLQEFRSLTPLKETYRFTSLTVIRMTKIMCNKGLYKAFIFYPTSTPLGIQPLLPIE